jgi:hypothetical protein
MVDDDFFLDFYKNNTPLKDNIFLNPQLQTKKFNFLNPDSKKGLDFNFNKGLDLDFNKGKAKDLFLKNKPFKLPQNFIPKYTPRYDDDDYYDEDNYSYTGSKKSSYIPDIDTIRRVLENSPPKYKFIPELTQKVYNPVIKDFNFLNLPKIEMPNTMRPLTTRHNTNSTRFRNESTNNPSRIEILIERKNNLENQAHKNNPANTDYKKEAINYNLKLSDVKFNLARGPNLENSFLKKLCFDEFCVYSCNKLYTLSLEDTAGKVFLNYFDQDFSLEESESLKILESDYLEENKKNIIKFQKNTIKLLSKKYNSIKKGLNSLEKSINNDFDMEEFIHDYVFSLNREKKVNNSKSYEEIKLPECDFKDTKLNEIKFKSKDSVLEKLVQKSKRKENGKIGGLLFLCGGVYSFESPNEVENKKKISLENAKYLTTIDELDLEYTKKIKQEIRDQMKNTFANEILKLHNIEKKITNSKKKTKFQSRQGDLSFIKKSNNDYIISKQIPKFIVKTGNQHFLFDKVNLETHLTRNGNNLSFKPNCMVNKSNYRHFFIWEDKTICYGDYNDSNKILNVLNIDKSKQNIRNFDKKSFAIDILKILDFGETLLYRGYTKNTTPVNYPSSLQDCRINNSQVRSLVNSGIKCYDNDRKSF